ncbi:hypothetical protein UAY_01785 [Enterococcus moraviensis ATCC BAA-383]|uniref:Scaffold protein n=1 Tax=Enterococcus moraviensis ATCC BAA-383 TaxID=1158609 RepID=R2TKQ2_9ENTE|nr:DUF4355 domain-containing protein [Enterococcus moraviensis]EOI00682.1 hypothetical protein UAY_01785 [Enterococcus moraviensis ATCC BAA-383]EOT73089.1 hypothetical protein I586_00082 [Enterococcus moraviensis ATCC BAA-383]
MKKRLLMPLHLQFFADPDGGSGEPGGTGTPPAGDPNPNDPANPDDPNGAGNGDKTFTRDEVAKMIAAETSKKQKAWEKEQQEKQAEAAKLAKMNAQEKSEHEKKQLEAKIAELERGQTLAAMTTEASKMLSEASLPHDDDLLSLIVSDDAEATKGAVAIITNFVSKIKKENARQQTPAAGGQFDTNGNKKMSTAELAKQTRIIK